jgi:cytochrome c oxidase subunit II
MILWGELQPPAASSVAGPWDLLFMSLLTITGTVTLAIAATIIWFAVKYRRRHADEFGANTASPMSLEITWTVIPLLIFLVIYVWSAQLFFRMTQPPANAISVQVVGKQWMWKFQQPNGRKEINELHLPLGKPVKLVMTSEDVIHSLYIPAFRIKQDVLPGRYTTEWFIPTRLGEYELFCSEYCGTSHSRMRGRVIVMEAGDYEIWASNAALDERPEDAGARLFAEYGCAACHGQQAPTLAGVYGTPQTMQDGTKVLADEDYVRESILYPRAKIVAGYQPIMPSFQGQLSEEQIFQLIAYIKSLKNPAGPPPTPSPMSPGQGVDRP